MKVSLIVQIPGPMHGKKIPITIPTFTIGRNPKSTLQADDAAIADRHCALEIRADQLVLCDLDSPHGTFVNDARIAGEMQVRDGDRLQIGPLLFRVSIEADQKAAPPPPKKAAPKIKVSLVVQIAGPMKGQKVPITVFPFTIGRDPTSTLQADDPSIAQHHCALAIREGMVYLRDLDSAQGTFVNNARITGEIQLQNEDSLKVGPLIFHVHIETERKVAPAQEVKKVKPKRKEVDDGSASFAASQLLKKYCRGKRMESE